MYIVSLIKQQGADKVGPEMDVEYYILNAFIYYEIQYIKNCLS